MNKGIKILIALNAVVTLIFFGLYYLAGTYPFRPGDPLFALQSTAESSRVKLAKNPEKRVDLSFELVERRLADLAKVSEVERVQPAVSAFDLALTQAILSIQSIPEEEAITYYQNVEKVLLQTDIVISSLEKDIEHEHLLALQEKISTLQAATTPVEIQEVVMAPPIPSVIVPKAIPFLEKEVEHLEFELTDAHENLACEDCHSDGIYVDKSTECSTCHIREKVVALLREKDEYYEIKRSEKTYVNHFAGECSDCHTTVDWEPEEFEHEGVYECISCHYDSYPQEEQVAASPFSFISLTSRDVDTMVGEHYHGDCIDCHTDTEDWAEYEYEHEFSNCKSCHEDQPALLSLSTWQSECKSDQTCQTCHTYDQHKDKYGDECANCHQSNVKWLPVEVDHYAYPNCLTCHLKDRPDEKHYTRNCSACHNATDWGELVFDHSASTNCQSCHQAPGNHTGDKAGQCNSCHSLTTWTSGVLNHTMSNCSNCHKTPVNHYPASCTSCHVTNSWLAISVNHAGMTACMDCHKVPTNHYPGLCRDCHNTSTWAATVDVHKYATTTCSTCHITPVGHDPGSCETCHHTTSSWSASYDHSLNYTCSTCHPKPYGHWTGECSNCHFTDSWSHVVFDHTGFTDCKACHIRPAGHERGQCSNCHNTTTWYIPPTPTPLPTNTPLPTPTPLPTLTPTATLEPTPVPTDIPTLAPDPTDEPTLPPEPTDEPTAEPPEETGEE